MTDSWGYHTGPGKALSHCTPCPGHLGPRLPGLSQECSRHLFLSIHVAVVFRRDSLSNDETISRHFLKKPGKVEHFLNSCGLLRCCFPPLLSSIL